MGKVFKVLGTVVTIGLIVVVTLGIMAVTGAGFGVIEGHETGVKKEGTNYVMQEYNPGYYFFIPFYSTLTDVNGRPVMFNWSKEDAHKESTDEMRYKSMITGVDKNGVPLSFALAMEITPVKDMMAEMFQETGSYENAMDKKAIQPSKSLIKDVMGEFEAKDIQSQRNEVSKRLNTKLREFYATNKYFKLDSAIDLKEIEVPEKIKAKQIEVQTAIQNAKISEQLIVQKQNEAKSEAAKAKGIADKNRIEGQGEADRILLVATAQAQANNLVSSSLTEKILRNNAIQKWNGVKSMVSGQNQLILDLSKK